MQKNAFKASIYKVIVPICLVLLLAYIIKNADLDFKGENNSLKVLRSANVMNPKVNWLAGWQGQTEKKNLLMDFAREYEFTKQNVDINLQFSTDANKTAHAREIVKMIQNNIYEWDIVWIDETVYYLVSRLLDDPNWGHKYLVDFQNIEGYVMSQRPEILKNPVILSKTDSLLAGPYIEGFYGAIWYNKKVADRINLEIKGREMNFNDLIQYAQRVNEYNQANNTALALFSESADLFSLSLLFQHVIWSGIESQKSMVPPALSDTCPIFRQSLQWFEGLSGYNPLIESHNVSMWQDAKQAFLDGKALFMVGKTALYNELFATDSSKTMYILPAELPSPYPNKAYIGSFQPSFAIFNSAPNRDLAIQIFKQISTPRFAEKWSKQTKNPTGIAVNIKENILEDDPYRQFLVYIAQKYQYNVRFAIDASYLAGTQNAHLYNLIDDNLRLLLSGQLTAEDVFNNINNNLTQQ
jgi:hypothetical protein